MKRRTPDPARSKMRRDILERKREFVRASRADAPLVLARPKGRVVLERA